MHVWFSVRRTWALGLILAAVAASPAIAQESDDDTIDAVPAATEEEDDVWILGFKVQALRTFTPTAGAKKGRVYWYMLYRIENESDEDREFYLSIRARSDRKKTYMDLFLPTVETGIEKKLGRSYWGQTDRFKVLATRDPGQEKYNYTTIKAGEKRDCIAVFNRLDPNSNLIEIEVFGLSNDIEREPQEDGTTLIKERVRLLRFERIGDEYRISQDPLRRVDRSWVKRQTVIKPSEET